jgi:hypothetical protein
MMRFLILLLISLGGFLSSASAGEYPELESLKRYSREALNRTGLRLSSVDPKFLGVRVFGKAISSASPKDMSQIEDLTLRSQDYWRAMMEMSTDDPSVLFAHGYMLASIGEAELAINYMLLGSIEIGGAFRPEIQEWQRLNGALRDRATKEIKEGVALHDAGKFDEAMSVYDSVLKSFPFCATAFHEKAISLMEKDPSIIFKENPTAELFALCRKHDPFLWQAYQGKDPKVLKAGAAFLSKAKPFYSRETVTIKSFSDFAEGCEEMELFPIAAACQWKLVAFDKPNYKQHLIKYLALIEKAGCPNMDFFKNIFASELLQDTNQKIGK